MRSLKISPGCARGISLSTVIVCCCLLGMQIERISSVRKHKNIFKQMEIQLQPSSNNVRLGDIIESAQSAVDARYGKGYFLRSFNRILQDGDSQNYSLFLSSPNEQLPRCLMVTINAASSPLKVVMQESDRDPFNPKGSPVKYKTINN